jgi:hypothetical protein
MAIAALMVKWVYSRALSVEGFWSAQAVKSRVDRPVLADKSSRENGADLQTDRASICSAIAAWPVEGSSHFSFWPRYSACW